MDWKNKLWVRILAVIVFLLMLVGAALSAAGLWACVETHVYSDGGAYLRQEALYTLACRMDSTVENYYYDSQNGFDAYGREHWEQVFSPENTNFFFRLKDADGKVVLSSAARPSQYHSTGEMDLPGHEMKVLDAEFSSAAQRQVRVEELDKSAWRIYNVDQWEDTDAAGKTVYHLSVEYSDEPPLTIERYIAKDFTAKDEISFFMGWTERLISARNALPWLTGIFSVLALAALIFLLILSARRKAGWLEKIPLDLLAFFYVCLAGISFAILEELAYGEWIEFILIGLMGLVWVFLILRFVVSIAIRAKAGTLWKNNILYHAGKLLWRFCKWFWAALKDLARSVPLFWRTAVIWIALCFCEFIGLAMFGFNGERLLFCWFLEKLVLTPLLFFAVLSMQRLQKGAKRIAEQGPGEPIDLTHMYGPFQQHGEYLNHISDGLQAAVEEGVRSERMKAELITNVSHDIKTPLTSIVNYVDLLEKEELENEKAKSYVEVLSRQAARLKKLTEDLVEASKASTGNIAVNLAPTDLNVLLGQAAGEFADRFRQKELELVLSTAPEQPVIRADGQLLWRVFSNLMTNIVKYAMPGTRVYLSTAVKDSRAAVTFRNISAAPLEKSGAELSERFVRGDASRTGGDGSGLGLSIAQSLTELQGGAFQITVDGDLFKAELTFPTEG